MKKNIYDISKSILCLSFISLIGGYLWVSSSLPKTSGTIKLQCVNETVVLIRDENGFPHIFATSERDAAFALGFAHAQDRLWQMDLSRRLGAGKLSEILGARALNKDRFLGTLGLYRLAEKQAAVLSAEIRLLLKAYVNGVNAFIKSHTGAWPIEFILLNYQPEFWQIADSLVWGKLIAFKLASGWQNALIRANIEKKVWIDRLNTLFSLTPTIGLSKGQNRRDLPLNSFSRIVPKLLQTHSASNTWVVSGSRTKLGKPIQIKIRETRHGPVISDTVPGVKKNFLENKMSLLSPQLHLKQMMQR